ncbi:MAG: tetratricopeptide repeat protein [Cryomorphaceae bacterium]|nr:tetratricopeptide repeat protein [Cryomorphaceae bacterium]
MRLVALLSTFLFQQFAIHAQSDSDWEGIARANFTKKNYEVADSILSVHHSELGFYEQWLFAQVKTALGQNKKADSLYQSAMELQPQNHDIKLDYGKFLFNIGKHKRSRQVLENYRIFQPDNTEAVALLAWMDLWEGKTKSAKKHIDFLEFSFTHPREEIRELKLFLKNIISTKGVAETQYYIDDQIVQNLQVGVQGGKFFHRYLHLEGGLSVRGFSTNLEHETNRQLLGIRAHVNNNILISQTKSKLTFGTGFFSISEKRFITFQSSIEQTISKTTKAEFSFNRVPYLFTSASLSNPFLYNDYGFSITYGVGEKRNAKLGQMLWQFPDGGVLSTSYAYFMHSIYQNEVVNFSLGYSINFATATTNTFSPIEDLSVNTPFDEALPGIYEPYFTPRNQWIHAGLGKMSISLEKIQISTQISRSLYAIADNPSLFADINGQGEVISTTYFSPITFTPIEFNLTLGFGAKNKEKLFFTYDYRRIFFFTAHQIGLKKPLGN